MSSAVVSLGNSQNRRHVIGRAELKYDYSSNVRNAWTEAEQTKQVRILMHDAVCKLQNYCLHSRNCSFVSSSCQFIKCFECLLTSLTTNLHLIPIGNGLHLSLFSTHYFALIWNFHSLESPVLLSIFDFSGHNCAQSSSEQKERLENSANFRVFHFSRLPFGKRMPCESGEFFLLNSQLLGIKLIVLEV